MDLAIDNSDQKTGLFLNYIFSIIPFLAFANSISFYVYIVVIFLFFGLNWYTSPVLVILAYFAKILYYRPSLFWRRNVICNYASLLSSSTLGFLFACTSFPSLSSNCGPMYPLHVWSYLQFSFINVNWVRFNNWHTLQNSVLLYPSSYC